MGRCSPNSNFSRLSYHHLKTNSFSAFPVRSEISSNSNSVNSFRRPSTVSTMMFNISSSTEGRRGRGINDTVDTSVKQRRCSCDSHSLFLGNVWIASKRDRMHNHTSVKQSSVQDRVSLKLIPALALRTSAENASLSCGVPNLSSAEFFFVSSIINVECSERRCSPRLRMLYRKRPASVRIQRCSDQAWYDVQTHR